MCQYTEQVTKLPEGLRIIPVATEETWALRRAKALSRASCSGLVRDKTRAHHAGLLSSAYSVPGVTVSSPHALSYPARTFLSCPSHR